MFAYSDTDLDAKVVARFRDETVRTFSQTVDDAYLLQAQSSGLKLHGSPAI